MRMLWTDLEVGDKIRFTKIYKSRNYATVWGEFINDDFTIIKIEKTIQVRKDDERIIIHIDKCSKSYCLWIDGQYKNEDVFEIVELKEDVDV